MRFEGIIIGGATFLIIGLFHPLIIKCEYYFTYKIWPAFLLVGAAAVLMSCFVKNVTLSAVLAVFGCSSLWSIIELHEQRERVEKGWFPKNPNRKKRRPTRIGAEDKDSYGE